MTSFNDLGLNANILKAIAELGFENPTPIQDETIPAILNGNDDVIALAQTGTGKTAGFGLPVLQQVDRNSPHVQAFIICPTRELCLQITKDMESYSKYMDHVNILAVYGGTKYDKQIRELKRGVQIVVGTPGRVIDLINKKALKINHIKWLILDEADEMLNMGFRESLDEILESTPAEKQTLLFSATMPKEVRRIASHYMKNPIEISVGSENTVGKDIEHHYYVVKASDKYLALKRLVDVYPDMYGIVFCRTRQDTMQVANALIEDGYSADVINGDLSQAQRDQVMNRFRTKQIMMLVATDVAARGIDVSELTHVVNMNLPDDPEVYIHRSGRTGRAGNKGISIIISHSREGRKLKDTERKVGKQFDYKTIPTGDQVFEQRLSGLSEKLDNIAVDEKKIAKVFDTVNAQLAHLTREDLLKRFITLEVSQIMDYYEQSRDLNASGSKRDDRSREERAGRRADKGGRSDDRRDSRNAVRSEGREKSRRSDITFSRFFINLGEKQKIKAANLLGLINEYMPSSDIEIGKIDILRNFSFFEIDRRFEKDVLKSFENAHFGTNAVVVEVASTTEAPLRESFAKKKKKGGGKKVFEGFSSSNGGRARKKKDSSKKRRDKKDRKW